MIGTTLIERYRIDRQLGSGGLGTVYAAQDELLGREVAVKVLDGRVDQESRARWLRESRAAAKLQHPHIVTIHDAGESNGTLFIVMELMAGATLREATLELPEAIEVVRQVCQALGHAHENGIVHRDVKPENVLLQRDNGARVAKLADLGVATLSGATRVTSEGAMVGTASYLSPEQILGQDPDGRADLYGLGVVLFELVTGRVPFTGEDLLSVVSQHLHAPVVPPRTYREDVPAALEAVILRCLAKRPEDRFATAAELDEALAAVRLDEPPDAPAAAPESAQVAMLDQLARGRLIGRRAELGQLRELWLRARKGTGHMALVSGEPGVGKSRLARELIVFAQLHGATVLQGGCYEFEGATPYLPFVEALRQWVRMQDDQALGEMLGDHAAELARLAPEIGSRIGSLAAPAALSAQEERMRLFDHVARFFDGLARQRGLLIFLDDLHWADHGTIGLLHYLLRNLRQSPLLVLGAYREVELDRTHPLARALDDWNRERLATRVVLGRFTSDDTERLLATLFGQEEVSHDFAAALQRETEGNPFFLEEVVKSLIEQGQIYRESGAWQRRDVGDLQIPQSVKLAIGRRLERLPPESIEVLQTAAALGKMFEFSELVAVGAAPGEPAGRALEDKMLDVLDQAVGAQLLRTEGAETFVFTHDKIREVLHEELNPVRRRRLHMRIGEGLEILYAADPAKHAQDLAYHFSESSDLSKGLHWSLEAARSASRLFAHEVALGFFERARECAEALEATEELSRIEEGIGAVHEVRGAFAAAIESYERAIALAKGPRRRAALRATIGSIYSYTADVRGLAMLEEALRELDPETQGKERALALAMTGRYHHYRREHGRALEYLEQARGIAEPLGDPATLDAIYTYTAGALQHMARYRESNEWADKAIAMGERTGYLPAMASGNEFRAENAASLGRWEDVLKFSGLDRHFAERAGSLSRVAWSQFSTAWAYYGSGDLASALEHAQVSLELAERTEEPRLAVFTWAYAVQIHQALGNQAEAAAAAARAMEGARVLDQPVLRMNAASSLARIHEWSGEWSEVVALLEPVWAELEGSDNRLFQLFAAQLLAEALERVGRSRDADVQLENAFVAAREASSGFALGLAFRAHGQIRALRGEPERGLEAFDEAVRMFDETGSRLELARTLSRRAELRSTCGDKTGAAADAARARELFDACGAVPERDALV